MHGPGELGEIRLLGDDADSASHGAGTVQRALWAAQHLDVIDVEDPRIERVRQRSVIDIEARDVIARDAADRDSAGGSDAVASWGEGQVRHLRGIVEEVLDRLLLERGAAESRHRHGHRLLTLRALLRRHDNFLETFAAARLGRRGVDGCRCDEQDTCPSQESLHRDHCSPSTERRNARIALLSSPDLSGPSKRSPW